MNELVKVNEHQIGIKKQLGVDARELWNFLGVKTPFDKWIRRRLKEAGFVDGQDFIVFDKFVENSKGGRPQKEYVFSIGASKEVAMLERNDKGREVRQYFIDCEEKYLNSTPPTTKEVAVAMSTDPLVQQAEMFLALVKRQSTIEAQVVETRQITQEAKQIALEALEATKRSQDFVTILGYARKHNVYLKNGQASSIGKKISSYCKANGIRYESVDDEKWGKINVYPYSVLDQHAVLFLEKNSAK